MPLLEFACGDFGAIHCLLAWSLSECRATALTGGGLYIKYPLACTQKWR